MIDPHVCQSNNQLLLDLRASCNVAANDGLTPVILACWDGHAAVAKCLLAARADPRAEGMGVSAIMVCQKFGKTHCEELIREALASEQSERIKQKRARSTRGR